MSEMHVATVYCSNKKSVEAMSSLLQNCDPGHLNIGELSVDDIGADGWAMLAKGLSAHPGCLLVVYAHRESAKEGRMEELKIIWESLTREWRIDSEDDMDIQTFHKHDGEDGWEALQQTLNATE